MKEIHFVCDTAPGPTAPRFIELEDETGHSISLGEWREQGRYWHLVIPYEQDTLREALGEAHEYQCGCNQPGRLDVCVAEPTSIFACLFAAEEPSEEVQAEN